MNPEILHGVMLVCFGFAWPFSIGRMVKTKSSSGKSVPFVAIVLIGYICGVFFQYFGARSPVIFLYILNAAMVTTDLTLTLRYRN